MDDIITTKGRIFMEGRRQPVGRLRGRRAKSKNGRIASQSYTIGSFICVRREVLRVLLLTRLRKLLAKPDTGCEPAYAFWRTSAHARVRNGSIQKNIYAYFMSVTTAFLHYQSIGEYRHNHVLRPNHQLSQPAIKMLTLLTSPIRKCYLLASDIYSYRDQLPFNSCPISYHTIRVRIFCKRKYRRCAT